MICCALFVTSEKSRLILLSKRDFKFLGKRILAWKSLGVSAFMALHGVINCGGFRFTGNFNLLVWRFAKCHALLFYIQRYKNL